LWLCTGALPEENSFVVHSGDHNLANELTDILIEGSAVEIEVSFNESSAYRALRKAGIDYEIVE